MQFKCNHCERIIPYRYFGAAKIQCWCGAKYTKVVTVEVREEVSDD